LTDLTDGKGTRRHIGPVQLIDDARKLLFNVVSGDLLFRPDNAKVVALDLDSGEETVIADPGGFARYVPSGHLLVAHGSDDFSLEPFDIGRLEATGPRVPYRAGLVGKENGMVAHLAFALDGTMVHEAASIGSATRELIWFGMDGEKAALNAEGRSFTLARLSGDRERVVVTVENDQGQSELWLHHVTRGGLTKRLIRQGSVSERAVDQKPSFRGCPRGQNPEPRDVSIPLSGFRVPRCGPGTTRGGSSLIGTERVADAPDCRTITCTHCCTKLGRTS